MSDILSKSERSQRMSLIRSRNTKPEMFIRKTVYSLGYRYRLHNNKLPGRPDLTFAGMSSVIFVHGCFWHQHEGCKYGRMPKSHREYWVPKLNGNKLRDKSNIGKLERRGWRVMVIWECETKNLDEIRIRIRHYLNMSVRN